MDICFIMCIFALMFMHVDFMNFDYVKMRKNGVVWCFCEVIVVNEFCELRNFRSVFYMNFTVDKS